MRSLSCFLFVLVADLACAATINVDFESIADGTVITNEYLGLTFTNARAITSGLTLNELQFPPRSGSNVADDFGGPINISFSIPVLNFAGYFTYSTGLTLTAYDSLNQVVGSTNSAFSSNVFSSPNSPNEQLQLSFAGGISRVTLAGGSNGGSFVVDDLAFTTPSSAEVPEPATFWLLLPALAVLRRAKK